MNTAANLAAVLSGRGFEISRDPTLVRGDPFWRRTVRAALDKSELLVVLWSRHAACSPWVDEEVRYFDKDKLFVLLDRRDVPPCIQRQRVFQSESTVSREVRNAVAKIGYPLRRQDSYTVQRAASEEQGYNKQTETDDNSAGQMNRQRHDLVTAEERRLKRFCRDMGNKVTNFTQVNDRCLRLSDGSLLIRLPNNSSGRHKAVRAIYLAATPVTNEQYRQFVTATGLSPPVTWRFASFGLSTAPVTGVSWFDAKAYAAWIGGDLPTQEEWEAAATGGESRIEYATSDGRITDGAAYFGVSFAEGSPRPSLEYSPNPSGFYGMCGNTWDWCSTRDGDYRRICGGGYMDSSRFCKVKAVYRNAPIDLDCSVGFRIKLVI